MVDASQLTRSGSSAGVEDMQKENLCRNTLLNMWGDMLGRRGNKGKNGKRVLKK